MICVDGSASLRNKLSHRVGTPLERVGDYDESASPIRLKLQTLHLLYEQDNTKTHNLHDPQRSLKTVMTVDGRLLELMSVVLTAISRLSSGVEALPAVQCATDVSVARCSWAV